MELTKEVIKSMYFDGEALMTNAPELKQINTGGGRYYFRILESGEPKFYISATTLIKRTTPTNEFLIKWIADMGWDKSREYTRQRAVYGTALHSYAAWLMIDRTFDFEFMENDLIGRIKESNIPPVLTREWLREMKRDILAFAQFLTDVDFKILAIEIALSSEKGFAGMLDIVGELDVVVKDFHGETYKSGKQKGEPKRTNKTIRKRGIVDIKSGRKGFYDEHKIQLEAYKRLWDENFPDYKVDGVFNWSPKEWKKTPSYNFTEQTDKINDAKFDHLVEIAILDDFNRVKSVRRITGKINLDKPETLNECNNETSLLDFAVAPEPKPDPVGEFAGEKYNTDTGEILTPEQIEEMFVERDGLDLSF